MNNAHNPIAGRPVVFGEVLFDHFEDGASVLGGAPFNVAWHLRGFGLSPLFISRVGTDPPGFHVRERMEAWGMDITGLQNDPDLPTGAVNVTLRQGQPEFSILPDQAYDNIQWPPAKACLVEDAGFFFYHGSLAARSEVSHETLRSIRQFWNPPTLVDVNLRPPWWNRPQVTALLEGAQWVKLNQEELAKLMGGEPGELSGLRAMAAGLAELDSARQVVVTRGEQGACILCRGPQGFTAEPLNHQAPQGIAVVDTVGAGDAFSAILILGLYRGWSVPMVLERAVLFSAAVCGIRGAVSDDPAFYAGYRAQWAL